MTDLAELMKRNKSFHKFTRASKGIAKCLFGSPGRGNEKGSRVQKKWN